MNRWVPFSSRKQAQRIVLYNDTTQTENGAKKMEEKIPRKKMGELRIQKEQINELKAISAVTKILADNPKLAKDIVEVFNQVAAEKEHELVERVTGILAEETDEVTAKQIKAAFSYWYSMFTPEPLHWFLFRSPPPRMPDIPQPSWFLFRSPPAKSESEK